MGKISFHSHDVPFVLKSPRKISNWIKKLVSQEKRDFDLFSFIFCSDEYLYEINKKYLNHDTYTDIITFDYSEEEMLEGEIYISVERVRENALKFKVEFEVELRRVLIHGVLHLMGYSDKTQRQRTQMRKKEQACLSLYP